MEQREPEEMKGRANERERDRAKKCSVERVRRRE